MKGNPISYSKTECSFLSKNRTMARRELTVAFNAEFGRNLTLENIKSKCTREGWHTGRSGQFEKGNVPHPNAGTKTANRTSFRDGNKPHNQLPVGSERVNVEGYIEVKTAEPRTWSLKHRVVWERFNGPIDSDINIRFLDNNPKNCNISNLEAVSNRLNMQLNRSGYGKLPAEIKPIAKTIAEIECLVHEKRKHI